MIKRYICLLFMLLLFTSAFSDNESSVSSRFPTEKYCNGSFEIDNIISLDLTYWIKEDPFLNLDYSKSHIEFNKE